ncbi:pre-mRNA splicing factor, putative [Paecilomyces variotii No. 5]|uniref:Pre-mRNA splicing factor, putative n=1 Tax=Byssochlamys spectabilis (strain No. 5 / NBRC 109023) TaxID=1356009 RepID=V5HS30_BYSSN|nr:pre-mRNA splicing factor, putative [Paecilomyces variotii No. 5]
MAASTANGTPATPTLPEEVSKPPEGVVLPPKDIRAIVEKTAGYVARNGAIFEDRVREKEKNNPKFSFLNPNDAYAPFYQWRLSEIREGRGTAVSAGRPGEVAAAPEPETPKGPAQPPDFHFSARMPIINAQDLEVVKLTALFVAKRGKSFMTALSQRETRNFQFDFLRPQHSLYQFFSRLVDQYTILLRPDHTELPETRRIGELEYNVKNKYHVLERAKQRAEWVKFQEQQKQKKEEEEEKEKIEYAQIDWHDFQVVETVLFTEADDQAELPPPTSLNDIQSASLEQKAMMSLNPLRIEEAMPTDTDGPTFYNAYPTEPTLEPSYTPSPGPQVQPQQPLPGAAPTPYNVPQPAPVAPVGASREDEEHAAAAQAAGRPPSVPGQPPMRIRSDYVPRAQARRLNNAGATALCPNCKQQIPVAELEHHMRIELLDPRWKEQRAKAESRSATTNLSTVDVVNNLKRLASQRSDVFDSAPIVPGEHTPESEEEARRKRMAMGAQMPAYPGAPPLPPGAVPGAGPGAGPTVGPPGTSPNPQNMDINEQIRQIHQRYGQ